MVSGIKNLSGDSTGKKNESEKPVTKTLRLSCYNKNMRSMHSSERIEEMVCELDGYRWDAILLSETWRQDKSEIFTNTYSWEQEDTTTNTALELC